MPLNVTSRACTLYRFGVETKIFRKTDLSICIPACRGAERNLWHQFKMIRTVCRVGNVSEGEEKSGQATVSFQGLANSVQQNTRLGMQYRPVANTHGNCNHDKNYDHLQLLFFIGYRVLWCNYAFIQTAVCGGMARRSFTAVVGPAPTVHVLHVCVDVCNMVMPSDAHSVPATDGELQYFRRPMSPTVHPFITSTSPDNGNDNFFLSQTVIWMASEREVSQLLGWLSGLPSLSADRQTVRFTKSPSW